MRYEVKMSLQVGEGIGLDRCEYVGACIFFFFFFLCVSVHVCVYVSYSNVAQAWKVFAHIFPWRA